MGLQVVVVGAGLGGLAAAIALHREGHNVKVCIFSFKFAEPLSKLTW